MQRRRNMSIAAVMAIVAFVGLFSAWVILPTFLRKRHQQGLEASEE